MKLKYKTRVKGEYTKLQDENIHGIVMQIKKIIESVDSNKLFFVVESSQKARAE